MDRQSEPPGPEIGWAFGGIGFVATVVAGWLMDSGVGFGLFALIFWFGIGSLFAFLVERSAVEELDRVDELQNTRLATLAPAAGTVGLPARPERQDEERRSARPGDAAEAPTPGSSGDGRPRPRPARGGDEHPGRPSAPSRRPGSSSREYREARAEAERRRAAA